MANPEHLAALRLGSSEWNSWRETHRSIRADLRTADLKEADLSGADLSGADLSGADLSGADLREADLSGADLSGANLSEAIVGWTTFADVDLSSALNLDTVRHDGPSTIGIDTIYKSKEKIPDAFLR